MHCWYYLQSLLRHTLPTGYLRPLELDIRKTATHFASRSVWPRLKAFAEFSFFWPFRFCGWVFSCFFSVFFCGCLIPSGVLRLFGVTNISGKTIMCSHPLSLHGPSFPNTTRQLWNMNFLLFGHVHHIRWTASPKTWIQTSLCENNSWTQKLSWCPKTNNIVFSCIRFLCCLCIYTQVWTQVKVRIKLRFMRAALSHALN